MLRKARVLVPNCPHHFVHRGHNRKAAFSADEDGCNAIVYFDETG